MVVSLSVTSRGVGDDGIDRGRSVGYVFSDRIAPVYPPSAAQPNAGDLQYRGRLDWSGGKIGGSGEIGN